MSDPGDDKGDKPRRGVTGWFLRGGPVNSIIKIGAVAAAIATITGLVFQFDPGLKPGSGGCGRNTQAGLRQVFATNGRFSDYLDAANASVGNRTKQELASKGVIVTYTLDASADKGKSFGLKWRLVRVPPRSEVVASSKNQVLLITPDACVYAKGYPVWLPSRHDKGLFYVQLMLYGPDRLLVNSKRSEPFSFA